MDNIMLLLSFLSGLSGMVWMALTLASHWQQVFEETPLRSSRKALLRVLAVVSWLVSLLLALVADHPSMAVLVTMLLAFRPRWLQVWARWQKAANID